jgi:hypothetical protein
MKQRYQVGSEKSCTVKRGNPGGIPVIQEQTSPNSSIVTSQAWQEPIKHPVGMSIPARAATDNNDSPTSAATSTSSGKKQITTLTEPLLSPTVDPYCAKANAGLPSCLASLLWPKHSVAEWPWPVAP